MIDEVSPILSPQGQRRREEIGRLAAHAARRRKQRRSAGRAVAAFVCVGLVLGGMSIARLEHQPTDRSPIVATPVTPLAHATPPSTITIARIETDSTITDRLAIRNASPRWRTIGDDELLRTLADAGHPAGLISMNGQEVLLTR
jgi:hypothetical protein